MGELSTLEHLQRRFLDALYRKATPGEIVLKGGLALRAVYGQHRRTTDIDLDQNPKRSLSHLKKLIRSAINTAIRGTEFASLKITEPKMTQTVARWKLSGHLADGQALHMSIEISRRHEIDTDNLYRIALRDLALPGIGTPGKVDTYIVSVLARQKTMALLDDKRHAPRDLFDLSLLLENPDVKNPLQGIGSDDLADMADKVWDATENYSWPEFRDEVVVHLDEAASNFDENRFIQMQLHVSKGLLDWIASAQTASEDGIQP